MRVLHVAEKNSSAKTISAHLSNGTSQRREGKSKFNKIYEWEAPLFNQNCKMIMTSVSGHLLKYDFTGAYSKWQGCRPLSLFDAPIVKQCIEESSENIKKTLEREVKACGALVIWNDCDREGENIGFEIIKVCRDEKPDIKIYRAKFSEITKGSVNRALCSLKKPDKKVSDAVDVRSELDLRICSAFTRFQTMLVQEKFPRNLENVIISYGSCLFPALSFVVDKFLAIERFQPESRWTLKVTHKQNGFTVQFRLAKESFPEKLSCQSLLDTCRKNRLAKVVKVSTKPKSKSRPLPLNTVQLEKQCSKHLGLTAKQTMGIAEKLYTQGFISYPRTNTNIFFQEMDLRQLAFEQSLGTNCSEFAQRILREGVSARQGEKCDQAHPPIHPTKFDDSLTGNDARFHDFIVRHFLACISKDAEGYETSVEIDIAGEKFVTTGLQINAKNYLEVFTYEEWNSKKIHNYQEGQTFQPITSIEMERTPPPNLLTEADLIALMYEKGIGTDSTRASIIDKLKSTKYVEVKDNKHLKPTNLGLGLIKGYERMGLEMITKPDLRAELENNLRLICEGEKRPNEVLKSTLDKYRQVLLTAIDKEKVLIDTLAEYLDERPIGGRGVGGGYDRENLDNTSGPSTRNGGQGRGGAGAAPKRPKPSAGTGTTKRKCGICGIEGHTKRTCRRSN